MARVWAHSQRKDGELLVMLALADFANDAGECWPSIPVLAEKARLTERQARRDLDKLEAAREIRRQRSTGGRNRRTHYFITLPENPDKITGKELQGKNNPVIEDHKTLTPMSGALNRHRTVNNKSGAKAPSLSSPSPREKKHTRPDPAALVAFEQFYQAYPRHVGKADALKVWLKLAPSAELIGEIMSGVHWYAESVKDTDPKYVKHPSSWLNARRWEDEPSTHAGSNAHARPKVKDLGGGMVEVDGRQMDRKTFERRYGQTKIAN
jgi:hypothetical protein